MNNDCSRWDFLDVQWRKVLELVATRLGWRTVFQRAGGRKACSRGRKAGESRESKCSPVGRKRRERAGLRPSGPELPRRMIRPHGRAWSLDVLCKRAKTNSPPRLGGVAARI